MDDLNSVSLVGRLTRDPELRNFANGGAVCQLGIAFNTSKKNSDGSWEDVPNYINVSVFGGQGEKCAEYLSKGRQVAVLGRLQYRSWEAGDGSKRNAIDIVAQRVQFLTAPNSTQSQAPAAASVPQHTADDDIPF